jgi:hypothetical protein
VVDEKIGDLARLGQIRLSGLFALEGEEGLSALVRLNLCPSVAGLIQEAFGLRAFLHLLVSQKAPVQVEVDYVVKTGAVIVTNRIQVFRQGLVSSGPDDVDSHFQTRLSEALDEGAGYGPVSHVPPFAGPRHDDQKVDRGRWLAPGIDDRGMKGASDHWSLHSEGSGKFGVL